MDEVITFASNASCFEQVVSGALFFGFVYYVLYIPIRDKKAGKVVPNLFVRIKNDLVSLFNRF